ncbi:type 4a pilus biogenesis protein PilO [candidate division NPL-UPA2 bacterium]|nr:type 4a pilus biogenesis protein PilO [candidate division NPL-UPA2 bacterium]
MLLKNGKAGLRNKKIQGVFLFLITLFAAYFFYVQPVWQEIQDARAESLTIKGETEIYRAAIARWEQDKAELAPLEEEIARLEAQVPLSAELQQYFAELEDFLLGADLTFNSLSISPLSAAGETAYLFLDLNLQFSGTQEELFTFIREVENHHYLMRIKGLSFSREGEGAVGSMQLRAFLSP